MNTDREQHIKEQFEKLLEMTSAIDAEDIMGLGECLNFVASLREKLQNDSHPAINKISEIRTLLEKIVLGDITDMSPVVEYAEKLCGINGMYEDPDNDGSHDSLIHGSNENACDEADSSWEDEYTDSHEDKTEEDVQILCDFIVESSEGLEALESSIVELENNPESHETINSIFRIFHTIKGVSGFLELKKINSLAHTTENLLDEIRQGTFKVTRKIIDIIFESVDCMKHLILDRKVNVEAGFPWRESDRDIKDLQSRISMIPDGQEENPFKVIPDEDISEMPIGEILVHRGMARKEDIDSGLGFQKEHPEKKLGEILVDQKKVDSKDISTVLNEQKNARAQSGVRCPGKD
jgi:two-component system chemotaxis sensor kinase CheA